MCGSQLQRVAVKLFVGPHRDRQAVIAPVRQITIACRSQKRNLVYRYQNYSNELTNPLCESFI